MKSLLTGLLVVGFAAAASAQTEVYLAGSTAYRGPVTKALEQELAVSGTSIVGAFDGSGGATSEYGATYAILSGSYGGNPIIVHMHWTGSAAGVVDLSADNSVSFMADSVATTSGSALVNPTDGVSGTNAFTGIANIGSGYATISAGPNVALSDAAATSVGKSVATAPLAGGIAGTTFQADITNAHLHSAGTLGESTIGILPFLWVAGAQTSGTAPFTNMTQEAASQLFQKGFVSVSALVSSTSQTPLVGDTNDYAFLVGRNEDSGTRVAAEAEAQVGSNTGKQPFGLPIKQYASIFTGTAPYSGVTLNKINSSGTYGGGVLIGGSNATETGGTGTTLVDIGQWPANAPVSTETSLNWEVQGHSGLYAGGDVANVLKAANPLYLNLIGVDGGGYAPDNWDPAGNGNSVDLSNKAYLVGYIAVIDASGIDGVLGHTGSAPNAVVLTYDGVAYDPAAIQNGLYDFWTFEHMYYNTTLTNQVGTAKNYVDAVADLLYNGVCQTTSGGVTDVRAVPGSTVAGIKYGSSVLFTRDQEGSPVYPLF